MEEDKEERVIKDKRRNEITNKESNDRKRKERERSLQDEKGETRMQTRKSRT